MADKQITFSIQVEGNQQILKNLTEAQKAVKELNKELKETEDQDVYAQKEKELIKAKAALSEFRKEQKNQIREFKAAQNQAGSYEDLNAQLVRARQEFKKLGAAERESADGKELVATIQALDAELKDLDKSIGQNQRNVGNYGEAFTEALSGVGGQFGEVIQGFKGIGEAASNAGNLISKAFVAFQAVQLIVEAVGAIDEFVDATREAQRQVELTFGTIGEETDNLVVKVKALSETFDIDLDQSLKATNALVQQFGIDAEEATDLLADGLASAADQSEFLGRATDDLGKLSSAGIDASEAIGLIAETTNKGINIDVISEGIISLRENAQGTADAIENAFGEEKAKEIAEAFKKEPVEALKIVAAEQKKLDQNSKESAELIANVFKGVGEENIKSVQAIADLNGNLDELKENAGESAERFDALRQANEDFAAAQVEVSNSLKGLIGNTEAFTTNIKTGLLQALSAVIDALKFVIDGIRNFIDESPRIQSAFEQISNTVEFLVNGFKNLPSVFAGTQAALKQIGTNISNFFEGLIIDVKVFSKQAEQAISFGEADARLEREINQLKERQKQLNEDSLTIREAFNNAYEASLKERLENEAFLEKQAAEERQKEALAAQKKEQGAIAAQRAKGDAEARKKAAEEEKKRLEELKKAQEAFTQEQVKIATQRAALLLELSKKIRDNQIALLEDTAEARRATIEATFQDELQALQQQVDAAAAAQEEREQKAIELFGENSQQVIELREQQAIELESIINKTAELEAQALEKRNKDIVELEKDLVKEQQAVRQTALNDTIANIDFSASLQLEKLKTTLCTG